MCGGRSIDPLRQASTLIEILGPHPSSSLDLDLDEPSEETLLRWFVGSIVLSRPGDETRSLDAVRALDAAGLALPAAITERGAAAVEQTLQQAKRSRPDAAAQVLYRSSVSLLRDYEGQLTRLAQCSEDLQDLGARLVKLAPGFGSSAAASFLRPLRDLWPVADELPLEPAAQAAAVHLGWLSESDEPSEIGPLRRLLDSSPDAHLSSRFRLRDVEASLARLGRRSCLRERPERCPLTTACPHHPTHPSAAG